MFGRGTCSLASECLNRWACRRRPSVAVACTALVSRGFIIDLIRGKWRLPIVRLLTFGTCWCWLEIAGVAMAGALWISGQSHRRSAHYAIQRWWSSRLVGALRVTCALRVEIEGLDTLGTGPMVALCRHASIADALVVGWVLSAQAHRKPRFVLKKNSPLIRVLMLLVVVCRITLLIDGLSIPKLK